MAKIWLETDKAMNRRVSHLKPVQEALDTLADDVHGRAEAALATHRKSGRTKVEKKRVKDRYKKIDWEIALVGKNAVAIEFGHQPSGIFEDTDTEHPKGLYILHKAAGLA